MPSSLFATLFLAILAILVMAGFIAYFLVRYQKRQLQHTREQDQLKALFEQELLRSQIEIQEETLAYVGREMHDNIGQMLSLARLYLGDLETPTGREKAARADTLVAEAVQSMRALSSSLNPDQIAQRSITDALDQMAERITLVGTFKVDFTSTGKPFPLGENRNLMLFRMCQEILSNALRHSKATLLAISLVWEESRLTILITDNGQGFSSGPEPSTGQGLLNLEKRAKLIGAEFGINSQPGKGTSVKIEVRKQ